ncbi:MAG TPA: sigma-70 family RNA polymerase sigma factor [Vicinamibacterales bacterium]|jgi:DNA-directed RNA polymerase specialized sigma24 family protein
MESFPPTRHSVIERIRGVDPDARREAFGDLVDGYWKPVYKHLRITWRLESEDARDLTQAFFTDAFQKSWLERYEPAKARFRTFVRVCADRFVMNMRQSASRLKRGGGVQTVALDFEGAEREIAAHLTSPPEPEAFFHQEFVRALFDKTVQQLREEYEASGRPTHFALFERYDLAPAEGVSYAQLASEFKLTTTQVTNTLAQVRRRFRDRALDTLRGLCGSDQEYRREARELFGVEVE